MPRRKVQETAPNNVLRLADSPMFQPKKMSTVFLPKSLGDNANLFTMNCIYNTFGFASNDLLICKGDFDESEIKPSTLVIAYLNGAKVLTCNVSNPSDILGVVIAFQRKVQ